MTLSVINGGGGAASASDEERWARLAWSRLAEPQTEEVTAWLRRHGPVEALARLRAGSLDPTGRYDQRLESLDIDSARRSLDRLEVRVVIPGDDDWPEGVEQLANPPICLYVRGRGGLGLVEGGVAVVGSRAATPYGLTIATELGEGLAARGIGVVSGAAFGIDAAAHRGALAAGGPTVSVLARGLDRAYPAAHDGLLRDIAEHGAVVSELPLGWAPFRHRFLARNRLIAAMTAGTVVVEAGLRSGSLNTARTAAALGRHVAAVPGPVTSVQSAGCHELIRETGASLVTDTAEVVDLVGRLSFDAAAPARAPSSAEAELDPVAHAVWSAIPLRRGADLAALQRLTAVDTPTLLSVLGRLGAVGLVRRDQDRWRKVLPD